MMARKKHTNGNNPATQADLSLLAGEMTRRFDDVDQEFKQVRGDIQEMRGDIQEMRGDIQEMRGDIQEMRGDINNIHSTTASLQRGQEAILSVVTSIDEQLRELKTLPVRVARLERSRH